MSPRRHKAMHLALLLAFICLSFMDAEANAGKLLQKDILEPDAIDDVINDVDGLQKSGKGGNEFTQHVLK